jgi:outer membrane immunogenic protein
MKKILVAAIAAVAMSGAASAADMSMPLKARAAPAPVYNWTGCYLGGGGGYSLYDNTTQLLTPAAGVQLNQGGRGWYGTVSGGCDYQFAAGGLGNWVVGVLADGNWGDVQGSQTGQNGAIGLISGTETLKSWWDVGGRIGYLVTPSLLTYTSGGYAQARFSQVNYAGAGGALTGLALPATTYKGGFLGFGVEYAFNNAWLPIQGLFWRTEARTYDYRSQTPAVFATATGLPNGVTQYTHPYVQTVTSELIYRFNWH